MSKWQEFKEVLKFIKAEAPKAYKSIATDVKNDKKNRPMYFLMLWLTFVSHLSLHLSPLKFPVAPVHLMLATFQLFTFVFLITITLTEHSNRLWKELYEKASEIIDQHEVVRQKQNAYIKSLEDMNYALKNPQPVVPATEQPYQ